MVDLIVLILICGLAILFAIYAPGMPKFPPDERAHLGKNNRRISRKWLINDLVSAEKGVVLVTSHGDDRYWGDEQVLKSFRSAWKRGVEITMIVGPSFVESHDNKKLKNLAREGVLKLRKLDQDPDIGLRLTDDLRTYTTVCKKDSETRRRMWLDNRQYVRTLRNPKVADRQRRIAAHAIEHSRPLVLNSE